MVLITVRRNINSLVGERVGGGGGGLEFCAVFAVFQELYTKLFLSAFFFSRDASEDPAFFKSGRYPAGCRI